MSEDVQQIRYADVLARLQTEIAAATPTTTVDGQILDGLAPLRSRSSADFTLALADAWAVLAEILGFHSARHHEEACLGLASELRSLIELSRLVGYRPDPGVAASASLAFTIDDAGSAPVVTIPVGTAVTSVPNPGEQSVTFETVQAISARPTFNQLLPKRSRPQTFTTPPKSVLLAGTATNVAVGDGMLVPIGSSGHAFGIATAVTVRPDDTPVAGIPARRGWTRVELKMLPDETPSAHPVPVGLNLWPSPLPRGPLLSALSPQGATIMDTEALRAAAVNGGFDTADVFAALRASQALPQSVLVFRAQAGILGGSTPIKQTPPAPTTGAVKAVLSPSALEKAVARAGAETVVAKVAPPHAAAEKVVPSAALQKAAMAKAAVPPAIRANLPALDAIWTGASLNDFLTVVVPKPSSTDVYVYCDTVVRAAKPGPIVLRDGGVWRLIEAVGVDTRSAAVFTVAGKSTVLRVTDDDLTKFTIAGTSVYLAGELLPLAGEPNTIDLPAGATNIGLDDWVDGLAADRLVAITGMSATHPGLAVAHVSALKAVRHELSPTGQTAIDLLDPLPDALSRESVRINANVAPATHGQSRSEVLGSGQGQDQLPVFTLSAGPLTYISDASGSTPALTVYVNGVRRDRVAALLDPGERGYTVSQDDKQITTIQFGSPLPTGVINVRADYRIGLGAGAAVRARQLSMLASRPPGVRAVINPLPARGGADPETVDEASRNAPVSVRALGRAVSLVDYADFARAFPGIAKASARFVGVGAARGVQVTVIGPRGTEITTDSGVYTGLVAALAAGSDELIAVRVLPAQRVPIRVGADLRIDPDRITADVVAAARRAVVAALSFGVRDLGQPVWSSEIVDVLQSVPGVIAADVTALCRLVDGKPEYGKIYRSYLRPDPPAGSTSTAAVLLTLDVTSLTLKVVTP
ncbi:hypothetical protein Mycsm_06554 (plasmid) [Mycobacterium sp. JS623]|uniref:hypothetical protein n=1 Tax=Mycobacterium sp. JS623 TaxID=212767 RepID=UPI0002A59594|nr:hypothetical protein [Mycobacterium sp. JS623]AGB26691.1 hypothetical protein Mycsm_06554 [Mycobacterium sp. JS623]